MQGEVGRNSLSDRTDKEDTSRKFHRSLFTTRVSVPESQLRQAASSHWLINEVRNVDFQIKNGKGAGSSLSKPLDTNFGMLQRSGFDYPIENTMPFCCRERAVKKFEKLGNKEDLRNSHPVYLLEHSQIIQENDKEMTALQIFFIQRTSYWSTHGSTSIPVSPFRDYRRAFDFAKLNAILQTFTEEGIDGTMSK